MESLAMSKKPDIYSTYLDDNIKDLGAMTFYVPDNYSAAVQVVPDDCTARPDLLSIQQYGDDSYADLLCKINGISNPFELRAGMLIVVPGFDWIDKFVMEPDTSWEYTLSDDIKKQEAQRVNNNTMSGIPRAKAKTDVRSPNDATIGDGRFNIDPLSKLIIY